MSGPVVSSALAAAIEKLREIIQQMRNERPRYKSHDLGYVDSVSANNVDEWADELEAGVLALLVGVSADTATSRSDFDSGLCCMARHANAVPPWTCDCACHSQPEAGAAHPLDTGEATPAPPQEHP